MLRSARVISQLRLGVRASSTAAKASSGKLFDKILIANRGEISCRVSRTAHKLGIKTVAIYSDPDINGIHVEAADESVCVGPAKSTLSYLSIPRVIDAIERTGAQAVHPGYGFLSENTKFVEELEKRGITFIGPKATAMDALGDKIHSKKLAIAAGVSTIPGHMADIPNAEEAVKIAREVGYPVMVKASSGGGGKGMRICYTDDEVRVGYRLSKEEARSAFASDVVFIEKFIEEPRHIEIQLIADNHGNVVALPERECTIQRRNQKVIEESPSPFLDPVTRKKMQDQAASLARSVGYNSAGTCEFLVDKHRNFYFLEMNTRLQVEHPVTEAVTGLDLVELMIRSAAGEPLPAALLKGHVPSSGHAFESRVYAEDPLRGFLPSTGRLSSYIPPSTFAPRDPELAVSIREDAGVTQGSEISMFYDPMICKLITHDDTRIRALDRMTAALDSYVVRGVGHNISFLRDLTVHPAYRAGDMNTGFIKRYYPEGFKGVALDADKTRQMVASAIIMNAMKTASSFEITPRSEHAVMPEVRHMFVSIGQRTAVDGSKAVVQPRVFEAELVVADDVMSVAPAHMPAPAASGAGAADPAAADAAFGAAEDAVPQGDGSVFAVFVREVDPTTSAPLAGEAGAVHRVRLANVDWSPDSPLLLAYNFDAPAGVPSSESVLRVQQVARTEEGFKLQFAGALADVFVRTPRAHELSLHMLPKRVRDLGRVLVSPMPGALISLAVEVGQTVEEGQECAVVEAMKMQNILRAPKHGKVKAVHGKAGDTLVLDQVIVEFE